MNVTPSGSGSLVAINASSVKIGYKGRLHQIVQRFVDLVALDPQYVQEAQAQATPLPDEPNVSTPQSTPAPPQPADAAATQAAIDRAELREIMRESREMMREARESEVEKRLSETPPQPVDTLGLYPLKDRGQLIGGPGQGTHSRSQAPDNWQSDNAVDIRVPVGTPVLAVEDGVIGDRIGPLNSKNPRMAGLRAYVETDKNEYYYQHLSKLIVKAGQHVRKGEVIGYSGEANGVPHLHFGQLRGDPRQTIRKS